MSADERGNENWSEAVEDLVENGDVDRAISLLESVVTKLTRLIVSSREEDAHLQLATALGELANLHSCNGLSLKADELRSQSLLIRARVLHPELRSPGLSGSFGEKVVRQQETGNEISSNECQEEEDDWETIADLDTSLDDFSLSAQSEKGAVSPPSDVVEPSASPRRRGRGTFLYRKNELYSDQVEDEAFVDKYSSVDEDPSSNSLQDEDGTVTNQRYGTRHVIVLYDFPPTTRTTQLEKLFDTFRDGGVAIRWVSDSVALAVFQTPSADKHRREEKFQPGDQVLAYFRRQRFTAGTFHKLSRKKFGPFRILKQLGPNAYLLELPTTVATSPVFNIADLTKFEGDPTTVVDLSTLPFTPLELTTEDLIEDVLDIRSTQTRTGIHRRFLVRWANRPLTECSWIDAQELQAKRPDIFQQVLETYSSGDEFSPPREN